MSTKTGQYVWDPLVRFFHWSLVAAFAVAFVTEDDLLALHRWAGYVVLGLIVLRLVWGVIGSQYARFTNFVTGFGAVRDYLLSLLSSQPKHYTGHNPAGGWMVLVLLFTLLLVSLSGMAIDAAEYGRGLLAGLVPQTESAAELFEEFHEGVAEFSLALVVVHVAGVLVSSFLHGENLVRAMFTGRKP